MKITIPNCIVCKNFIDNKKFTCKAFPNGIPDKILTGKHDHTKLYKGDNGIRFEAIKTKK